MTSLCGCGSYATRRVRWTAPRWPGLSQMRLDCHALIVCIGLPCSESVVSALHAYFERLGEKKNHLRRCGRGCEHPKRSFQAGSEELSCSSSAPGSSSSAPVSKHSRKLIDEAMNLSIASACSPKKGPRWMGRWGPHLLREDTRLLRRGGGEALLGDARGTQEAQ